MIDLIKTLCFRAIIKEFPFLHKQVKKINIDISTSKENVNTHFQLNSVMKIAKETNKDSIELASKIKNYIDKKTRNKMFEIELTNPGFVNFKVKKELINKKIKNFIFKKKKD
jgi:arginyl-tRNA synthetase